MQMIDLAPTWGEFGLVYARLAESGEVNAVRALRSDAFRAFATAQAFSALATSCHPLTNEQMDIAAMAMVSAMRKQGVMPPKPAPHEPSRASVDGEASYRVFDPVNQATLIFEDLNKAIEAVRSLDATFFAGLDLRRETVGRYERVAGRWMRNGDPVDLDLMLFDAALEAK